MNGSASVDLLSSPVRTGDAPRAGSAAHPLSPSELATRAAEVLGSESSDALDIMRLAAVTLGEPRMVDLALGAVAEEAWDLDIDREVPASVSAWLSDALDAAGRDVREFLLALAVGFAGAGPALATAPRFARADTLGLRRAARDAGLVASDGTMPPLVRVSLLRAALPDEAWTLRRELVDAIEAAGMPLADTALDLTRQGYRDPRTAIALERSADDRLDVDPADAARRYEAAVHAGADETALDARRAHAAWACGDLRTAERLVDRMLGRPGTTDACDAVPVAAAVWARQGLLGRAADAYASLAGEDCALAPLAALTLAATGAVERARSLRETAGEVAFPTSSQLGLDLAAEGLLLALDDESDRALATLLRASTVASESADAGPLPEIPAVLAAQVALNAGEAGIADEVLASAIDAGQGGPAFRARLRLTRGLVALRADRPVHARAHLDDALSAVRDEPLGLRDALLASALRVGLARHQGEIAGLVRAWTDARQAIVSMQVDLTTIPALAELAVAAARVGEAHLVETHVGAAWEVLGLAGRPASWSTTMHWAQVEAALLGDDAAEVERHAAALEECVGDRRAKRLARAARTWRAALTGEVVVEAVERSAHDLVAAGYPWDAARLAGHAAGRAADHRDSLDLLALARSLHPDEARPDPAHGRVPPAGSGRAPVVPRTRDESRLSAREVEVARLVLEGKTYAEIGDAIFISPRTAEHHIARIRRRLGASSRSDLLDKLRTALADDETR